MALRDIEYAADHGPLEDLLLSIDRPADFCAHGRLFAPMPRLDVDGVGLLSFPVPEAQVGALIAAAERAPYGRGPDTLVDTAVRDCRQIDAARIRVSGGAWGDTFKRILDLAATGLGCSAERLDARLYKLLVYEPGGFFAPHRDTEKMDGMIATLAISLPVAGAGGELVVRHRGRGVTIDMEAGEPSELAFAAFYADCTHEARPVREGHRLSLVFNLCLPAGDVDTPRRAPDFTSLADDIAERLAEWRGRDQAADKLVWVLDHDYSEAGLSFRTLKGVDAARARVLAPAVERAACELYAAIVHAEVHGDATLGGDYVDGWGGWSDADADDMEIDEVYESRIWLDGWAGRDGGPPPFEDVPVLPGELLPQGALDDARHDEQLLHEATGNEGVSLERTYRRAAFVMWPRSRTLDVLAGGGIGGAVAWVAAELDRNGGTVDERIGGLVTKLIGLWPTGVGHEYDEPSRARMLGLLSRTGDPVRTLTFLREVVLPRYWSDSEHLPAAVRLVGPDAAGLFLTDLAVAHVTRRTGAVLALLRRIEEQCRGSAAAGEAWRDALRKGVQAVLRTLCGALAGSLEERTARLEERAAPPEARTARLAEEPDDDDDDWIMEENDDPPPLERRRLESLDDVAVRDLFALAWRCGLSREAARAASLVVQVPDAVAPDRTLPAALRQLHDVEGVAGTGIYAVLWGCAADSLLGRSATPPNEPRDWKIEADTGCDCADCAKLRAFCGDPAAQVGRFPLREKLRLHLEAVIRGRQIDIDHVTERKGRPYTLVCTKNRAGYERRLVEYAEDVSRMRSVVRSAPAGGQAARCRENLERLRGAVAAAEAAGRGRA